MLEKCSVCGIRATGAVLAALRIEDHAIWLSVVRSAIEASPDLDAAALALSVSARTLEAWMREDPALAEDARARARG